MIKTEPQYRISRHLIQRLANEICVYVRDDGERIVRGKMLIQNVSNQQNQAKSIQRAAYIERIFLPIAENQTLYFCTVVFHVLKFYISVELKNVLRICYLCKIILIYDQLTCDRRKRCHNHRIERRKATQYIVCNPCSFACSLAERCLCCCSMLFPHFERHVLLLLLHSESE